MNHESSAALPAVPDGLKGVTADWSADKQAAVMAFITVVAQAFVRTQVTAPVPAPALKRPPVVA